MRIVFDNFDVELSIEEILTNNPDMVQGVMMIMGVSDENITRQIANQSRYPSQDEHSNYNNDDFLSDILDKLRNPGTNQGYNGPDEDDLNFGNFQK